MHKFVKGTQGTHAQILRGHMHTLQGDTCTITFFDKFYGPKIQIGLVIRGANGTKKFLAFTIRVLDIRTIWDIGI